MLDQIRSGDTVVVYRLDRLGRTLRHLIDTVNDLEARGVVFLSLTESIDTSTPGGKLVFHGFGALAETETDLIRERTMAGRASARARGRKGGRPTIKGRPRRQGLNFPPSMASRRQTQTILSGAGMSRDGSVNLIQDCSGIRGGSGRRANRSGCAA